jgi:hypothetical protein
VNQTVQKKLGAWMKENNSTHWAIGCKICQWRCNTQLHQSIKDTPYHLTYGQHPHVGFYNFPLVPLVLDSLSTEADLHAVYLGLKRGMMDDGTVEESLIAQITGTTYADEQIAEVSWHVFTGVRCKIAKIEGQP